MSDESPAVAPAPAAAPVPPAPEDQDHYRGGVPRSASDQPASLWGLQVSHWLGVGAAAGGVTALDYLANLAQPVIHWLVTGGAPDQQTEHALAIIASGVALGAGALITNYTRRRAVPAAPQNGDKPNA